MCELSMIILAWTIVAIVAALITVLAFLTWPVGIDRGRPGLHRRGRRGGRDL